MKTEHIVQEGNCHNESAYDKQGGDKAAQHDTLTEAQEITEIADIQFQPEEEEIYKIKHHMDHDGEERMYLDCSLYRGNVEEKKI